MIIKKLFRYIIALMLALGVIEGKPIAFMFFGCWLGLISLSIFTDNVLLIKIVGEGPHIKSYSQAEAKFLLVFTIVLWTLGLVALVLNNYKLW